MIRPLPSRNRDLNLECQRYYVFGLWVAVPCALNMLSCLNTTTLSQDLLGSERVDFQSTQVKHCTHNL